MNISNSPSATQTATNVWGNAIRRITGMGTALATASGANRTSVANGTTTNLQPSAGSAFIIVIHAIGLANVTWVRNATNGVTSDIISTGASGAQSDFFTVVNNSFFESLQNTGTVSGTYNSEQIGFIS